MQVGQDEISNNNSNKDDGSKNGMGAAMKSFQTDLASFLSSAQGRYSAVPSSSSSSYYVRE
jgi:hypothetical protein